MPRNRRKIFFVIPFVIILAVSLLGLIVMLLWNFIFPAALHAEKLTYWQAVGLLVLCRVLFFRFRRPYNNQRPGMWRGGPPWRQKWMNMSDEERARFREEWKQRCRRPGDN